MLVQLKALAEVDAADEEQLTADAVDAVLAAAELAADLDHLGHLAAEEDPRQGHTGEQAHRQVVGQHGDHHRQEHHRGVALGDAADAADRIPVGGVDRDHHHHPHQGGHGDLIDPLAGQQDHRQQAHARGEGGEAGAAAVADVHHRLAHQGAAGHAAEERTDDVADALAAGLLVFVGRAVGDVVEDVLGQEGFHQAHQGDGQGRRQDQAQGARGEGNLRDAELGKAARQGAEAAHGGHVEAHANRDPRRDQDRHQGGGNDLGEARHHVDDHQGQGHQAPDRRQLPRGDRHLLGVEEIKPQLGQLRQEDQDRQGVHKARHDRLGHEAHLVGQP